MFLVYKVAHNNIGLLIWPLIVLLLAAYQRKQCTGCQRNVLQMDICVNVINT